MRTVDPLGRHDDCTRILEAVDAGTRVVVVGHPLLGSEAVRRRVTHTAIRVPGAEPVAFRSTHAAPRAGEHAVLSDDDSLDTRRAIADDGDDDVTVVRLRRLTCRQFDRLADDRLTRAGLHPDWLGRVGRNIIHAQSRGYPLLAAALLDDRLRPDRTPRAPAAAAAIVRALDPELRSAAEAIAAIPGVRTARVTEHLGKDVVDALAHVGIVDEAAGALVVPAILRTQLTRRWDERATAMLSAIVESWRRRDAATASEYIAAHRAILTGRLAPSTGTRARVAAIAACALASRCLRDEARQAAAIARQLDPGTLPATLAAIVDGETALTPSAIRDATAAGFDELTSRVVTYSITASALSPSTAGAEHADDLPPHLDASARLRRLGELASAEAASERGDHDVVARGTQAALAGGDPLVGVRAFGLLACDAAFRGDASGVLAASDGVHGIVGSVHDWTPTMRAAAASAIAACRMAAHALALPPMPLLDDALDRIVETAASTDDQAAIAFGVIARVGEHGHPEHAELAESLLLDLPDESPRRLAHAVIDALHRPDAVRTVVGAAPLVVCGHVAEIVAASTHVDGEAARATIARYDDLVDAGIPASVPLRVAAAALHARLGDVVPDLSDIDAATLPPVLRALHVVATVDAHRDPTLLVDAAAGIASAKHEALTRRLLAVASDLDAETASVDRVLDDLEASLTASRRPLRSSRSWIDRDIRGLAAAGLTDLQISQLLDLPLGTVRSRARAVMAQLGVPTRSALATR